MTPKATTIETADAAAPSNARAQLAYVVDDAVSPARQPDGHWHLALRDSVDRWHHGGLCMTQSDAHDRGVRCLGRPCTGFRPVQ
jgi:hypothetical protein